VLQTLWPAPKELIRRAAGGVKRVLVPEQNLGQYVHEVSRILRDPPLPVEGLCRMDTKLLNPAEIEEAIMSAGGGS
jgi:2-oxoglutarate ferredoxin oxidoreductase subunit alpha